MSSIRARTVESRRARSIGLLLLAGLLVFGVWIRVHFALSDPSFDRADPRGMLRTDPALLHYVTQRIVDSGGSVPADLRAEPRIEHPELCDWPAMETVGQEFVVAWAKLALAPATPLHVVATWAMAIFAALCVVGVYGLAWELVRSTKWAVLAATLYTVLLVNYRTIGFVLMREDFSLPWLALHLWLAARAVRVRTVAAAALAAVPLALFLATWHAAAFLFAVEAAIVLAWYVRSGENPLRGRAGLAFAALLLLAGVAVPALWSKGFLRSPGMACVYALVLSALLERSRRWGAARRALAAGGVVLACVVAGAFLFGGQGDFSHVLELLKAKVLYLGRRPEDPRALPFEARLLWVGPFRSGKLTDLTHGYALGAIAIAIGAAVFARGWRRGEGDGRAHVLAALGVAGMLLAMLIQRLYVLPGLVAPAIAALVFSRWKAGAGALATGIAAQAVFLGVYFSSFRILWYLPDGRVQEQKRLMEWISANVPDGEAIASDYENSAAILAATGRPVILQPKYETRRSRERIEEVYTALYQGPPGNLRRLLQEKYRCRWLLVDRMTLRLTMAYAGGLADSADPDPRTALARFLGEEPREFAEIPGYSLLYRSRPWPRLPETYRLYRLE